MLTALKDAGEEAWIFLLDVTEQLNGEVGGLGEQRLSLMGAVVKVCGSPRVPRSTPLLARFDQPGRPEDGQLLTGGTRCDHQRVGDFVDRRLPTPLERDERLALC